MRCSTAEKGDHPITWPVFSIFSDVSFVTIISQIRQLYKIAEAVITRFHKLGGLNNRIHSLIILEARNLSSRCWQCWFLLRPLSLTCKWIFILSLSLFFFFCHTSWACRISVPQPWIEPGPWQWKPRGPWQWMPGILTTRPPENSCLLIVLPLCVSVS